MEAPWNRHSINASYYDYFLHLFLFVLLISVGDWWREGGAARGSRVGKSNKKEASVSSSVAKPCIGFQFDFNVLLLRAMLLKKREE